MAHRVITAPAGPPATAALADAIAEAKGDDPLAPVTVVVPSTYAGLSLRRRLAADRGLVNVAFMVAGRLAELLGAPRLAAVGSRPVSAALRAEAIRAALTKHRGPFAPVAAHPATAQMLDRAFTELRACDEARLRSLSQSGPRAAAVIEVYRDTQARLAHWYDEHDLVEAAAAAVAEGAGALTDIGTIVVHQPGPDDLIARRLAEVLGPRAVLIEADFDPPPVGTAVVSVSDADEEARLVVRQVVALARSGVPLHRIGISYAPVGGYARLIHQHLDAAGLAANGPGVRTLGQTVPGLALLGALDLADGDLGRDDLVTWLAAAPIRDPDTDRPVPAARWDADSRRAGVVSGVDQWSSRLARLVQDERKRRAELHDDPEASDGRLEGIDATIDRVEGLARFVETLAGDLQQEGTTWAELSGWAGALLDRYLHRGSLTTDADNDALAEVRKALDRLAGLDVFGTRADGEAFRRALERELDASAGSVGRFGDGVFVAPLYHLAGLDLDVVMVVGLVEGALPGRDHDDPVLPELERDPWGDRQRSWLHGALAAGARHRILVFPRADLRRHRSRIPSRWVLDTATALAGTPVTTADLESRCVAVSGHAPVAGLAMIASFEAGLGDGNGAAATPLEARLGRLRSWTRAGGDLALHPLARAQLEPNLVALRARAGSAFTEFDGNVAPIDMPGATAERPVSATSLETYATCPRRYLFARVLAVEPHERPEEVTSISAADRGSLVHLMLERFIEGVLSGKPRTLDRLLAVAERAFAEQEASGFTGRPLRWKYDQRVMRRELTRFFDEDHHQPLAAELAFGVEGEAPVTVSVSGGRTVCFRGVADRVDRHEHGLLVTDYKTGKSDGFTKIDQTTIERGTKLQLPLYGLAARQRYGGPDTPVEARYWFVSERGEFAQKGYDLDQDRLDVFVEAVDTIVDGLTAGNFPARPGEEEWLPWRGDTWTGCRSCDYDSICPNDRGKQWEAKREAPELARYITLAEPERAAP